jgi:hypothetical protein
LVVVEGIFVVVALELSFVEVLIELVVGLAGKVVVVTDLAAVGVGSVDVVIGLVDVDVMVIVVDDLAVVGPGRVGVIVDVITGSEEVEARGEGVDVVISLVVAVVWVKDSCTCNIFDLLGWFKMQNSFI